MSDTVTTPLAPILRIREVLALTGRSNSSLYEDIAAGRFPRQIKIGPRASGWLRSDVEAWLAERVAARAAEGLLTDGGAR